MSSDPPRRGGFAIPDPDRTGFRHAVPDEVELDYLDGLAVLRFGSTYVGPGREQRQSPALRDCLDGFKVLASADDQQILEFGRAWGPLELCHHLRPYTHSETCNPTRTEPVIAWREYASRVDAILRVGASLHQDRVPDRIDWYRAHYWPQPISVAETHRIGGSAPLMSRHPEPPPRVGWVPPPTTPERVVRLLLGERKATEGDLRHASDRANVALARDMNWREVARTMNDWLLAAGVHPRLYPMRSTESAIQLGLGWSSLSGAIAMELASALAHGRLFICDNCHRPFSTRNRRQPARTDRHSYCRNCGIGGRYKEVKRESAKKSYWRQRKPRRRSPTHPHGPARTPN